MEYLNILSIYIFMGFCDFALICFCVRKFAFGNNFAYSLLGPTCARQSHVELEHGKPEVRALLNFAFLDARLGLRVRYQE